MFNDLHVVLRINKNMTLMFATGVNDGVASFLSLPKSLFSNTKVF